MRQEPVYPVHDEAIRFHNHLDVGWKELTKSCHISTVGDMATIYYRKLFDCLDMPQFSVKPFIPVGDFLEKYSMAGGGHHIYIAKGNITGDILNAGTVLGMQALKI